uniref:Uncharacterized protein n=1 Tax=Parastrongyloides trichosuri TaxID=131310 RepID=A0A0N4Z3X3_PARTI
MKIKIFIYIFFIFTIIFNAILLISAQPSGRIINAKKYKTLPNGKRVYFLYRPGISIPFIANAPNQESRLTSNYFEKQNKNIVKKEHHFSHLLRQPIMGMSQWWNFEDDNRIRKV